MSRMIAVRSITGSPSADSRLRSCRGDSSSSHATRFASGRGRARPSARRACQDRDRCSDAGCSRCWTSSPTLATPAVRSSSAQLIEALARRESGSAAIRKRTLSCTTRSGRTAVLVRGPRCVRGGYVALVRMVAAGDGTGGEPARRPRAAARRAWSARSGRSPRRWARTPPPGEITTASVLEHVLAVLGGARRSRRALAPTRRSSPAAVRPRRRPARARRRRGRAPGVIRAFIALTSASSSGLQRLRTRQLHSIEQARVDVRLQPPVAQRSRPRCRRSRRTASRSCCSPSTARTPRRRRPSHRGSRGTTARRSRRRSSRCTRCRGRSGIRRAARELDRGREQPRRERRRRSGCSGS